MADKLHPTEIPLLPPSHELRYAGIHWVERMDYDGRGTGLEVWQWQPETQKWCRPNDYARGNDHELKGYRYVAVCPMPMFPDELKSVEKIVKLIKGKIPPELGEDYKTFKRFIEPFLISDR